MDLKVDLSGIKAELRNIQEKKAVAGSRVKRQTRAGDRRGAALSRKAYDYCGRYEKQLISIIDGYEHINSSEAYFTKDGESRYRRRTME